MASIGRRGSKWTVRWWATDGQQRQRTVRTKATAEELKREVEDALALGRDWEPVRPRQATRLQEVFEQFIAHRALRLGEITLRRYGEALDLYKRFLRSGGEDDASVTVLSKPNLDAFYDWLAAPGNGLHGRKRGLDTSRKIVEVVQLAWVWAEDSERWPDIPRPKRIEMLRSRAGEVRAPTWQEMDACIAACDSWYRKLLTVLRYSGLRVGETMLLTWDDVDLDRGLLTIRQEIAKDKRQRVVPLSPYLVEELSGWGRRKGWLIPSGRREGKRHRLARARDIGRAWERAGVRPEVWTGRPSHAFRKGFKSGLLNMKAHVDAVDYLQGHKLGEGSRGRYIDPTLLPLEETVRMVPRIGGPPNVMALPVERKAR